MWKQRRVSSFVAMGLMSAVSACKNPRYCAGHPDNDCRLDAAPGSCGSDGDCTSPIGVCDLLGTKTCVECTDSEHDACRGTAPACVDTRCRPCTMHSQCGMSNVCLPNGSCADPGLVAYVDPTGSDTMECSLGLPCKKVMSALSTMRPYVKLHGLFDEAVSILDQPVMIFADPGTTLTHSMNGVLLKVDGSSHVQIYDLEVARASGSGGFGIAMPPGNSASLELQRVKVINSVAGGISMAGGTLTVSQSMISDNSGGGISMAGGTLTASQSMISGNGGGGISISGGQFAIVGNVFWNNGSLSSANGGVNISTTQSSMNRLEFNSFNRNLAGDGIGTAIQCSVVGGLIARNNVMGGNGTLTNMEQVSGTCGHTYSIVQPGMLPAGPGNMAVDPRFAQPAMGNLHILPGSPAIGAADPTSDLTGIAAHDIDGDIRTRPADIGADEIP
jgi:hypothetical protein